MVQPASAAASPIPLRNGVSASCVVLPSSRQPLWPTVLDALAARLPGVERAEWQRRLAAGDVLDAQGQPQRADSPCHSGMRLYYWRHVPDEPEVPFAHAVLFQDAHLVVADKPHGLPVVPGGQYVQHTLLARLRRELNLPDLTPLHRIDRETAGLVVLGIRPAERGAYQRLFRERTIRKTYEAVAPLPPGLLTGMPLPAATAWGGTGGSEQGSGPGWTLAAGPAAWHTTRTSHLREDPAQFFRMQEAAESEGLPPNSTTHCTLLAVNRVLNLGLYRLEPVTGKRHQLRVHMAALGLPLAGDAFYPTVLRGPDEADDFARPLQLLARSLAFDDPVTGQQRVFVSQRGLYLGLGLACAGAA